MFTKHRGFKHELLAALTRCVATPFCSVPQKAGHNEENRSVPEPAPRLPKHLAREKYLAIPTFIRQGKTLGL